MKQNNTNGKAIYRPKGKAGEYSEWACNFYMGCSNNCSYCYCKSGFLGRFWTPEPRLKKCFKNEDDAFLCFQKELKRNIKQIREKGVFFTFSSDPMLQSVRPLYWKAVLYALSKDVPVQILTKCADFFDDEEYQEIKSNDYYRDRTAFGFTLTGFDKEEPGASDTVLRQQAMWELRMNGFRTFASIEPVLDFYIAQTLIDTSLEYCDLFKIGLLSVGAYYTRADRIKAENLISCLKTHHESRFYLKDSLVDFLDIDRTTLPEQFVSVDYNIFSAPSHIPYTDEVL